jgi:PAS domain S-box-containing protein
MNTEKKPSPDAAELRRRAEESFREKAAQSPDPIESLSPEETRRTLHELRVHQIELEMQNEELHRAQAELDASRARYFDLYDMAPVGYCTLSERGLILEVNLTAVTLLGVARRAQVNQPLSRFILPEDQDLYYRHINRLLETGEAQECELQMLKQDGTPFWAQLAAAAARDTDGKPVSRIVLSDITERKLQEEELRLTRAVLQAAMDQSPVGIAIADAPGGALRYVNDAGLLIRGGDRQSLVDGVGIDRYVSSWMLLDFEGTPLQTDEVPLARAIQYGETCRRELIIRRAVGDDRMVISSASPITNSRGKVVAAIAVFMDITESKQAEREREKLELQNRQHQKAESLGRMASAIAHHFNNQLQAVMMNLEMALNDLPRHTSSSEKLAEAMQSTRKAAEVSSLMLTYLGQTVAKCEPLDLTATCRQCLSLLQAAMPKNVVLETDLPAKGPAIHSNANQVQQILTSLITNAWEACTDGSALIRLSLKAVAATDIPAADCFPVGWQPKDTVHACLEVADTGCGIAVKDIEKLFDPFYSTKPVGRGLGLSAVLGIVRTHGGAIAVESERGRGSIFRIFLPVCEDVLNQKPVLPAQAPRMKGDGIAVLVVDDDAGIRNVVAASLAHQGFTVFTAQDGVEAVELFRQRQDQIRLVLCDLSMPRMDGWQTLSALRQLAPGIPVILCSGYSQAHAMQGDHPELPQAFLCKPFEREALSRTIFKVLSGKAQ